jgi:PAS domain S-box-containing protein
MNERPPTGQRSWEFGASAMRLRAVARVCAFIGLGLGLLGMTGWLSNGPLLTSLSQEYAPMSPWSAGGFILTSLALLFEVQRRDQPLSAIWARTCSAFTVALAAVGLLAMLTGRDSGFEGEPFQSPAHFMKSSTAGLSAFAAVGLVLLACGMLVLRTTPKLRLTRLSPMFGVVVVGGSFTVLLGYVYGTPLLYGGSVRPVSPSTAVGFFLLGIGLVAAAGPCYFPMRLFVGQTVSARMMRTFVPVTFIVVLLDELLSDLFRRFGAPNRVLQEALQTLISAIIVSWVVYQVARVIGAALDRANAARDESEQALGRARNELEDRVREQTASLAATNEELRREIGLRNENQKTLQESEHRFRQLTENIREIFWMTDPVKNELIYVSPAYEEIWGRTCRSLYASPRDWVAAIHPDDHDRMVKALTELASGNYDEEYRILRPDGSTRWVRDRGFPIHDESGKVYRIAGIAEDITGRKGAEAHIARLAHAVESTSELICITDGADRFTFVNRAFQHAYGYTAAELLGKTPEILFSPNNPPSLMQEILEQTRLGGWRGEVLDRRKDGTELPIFLSTSLITDQGGAVLGLMGVAQDITERKRAEERVRLLADAVQSTQELISITDHENRFTFVNQAFLNVYGYSESEVLGRTPDFLYAAANPPGSANRFSSRPSGLAGAVRFSTAGRTDRNFSFPSALPRSKRLLAKSSAWSVSPGICQNESGRKSRAPLSGSWAGA